MSNRVMGASRTIIGILNIGVTEPTDRANLYIPFLVTSGVRQNSCGLR